MLKVSFFPIIPVRLASKSAETNTSALIDSGATISIFQAKIAENLGITIENGNEIYLGRVAGRIKGYVHRLKLETANKNFFCPIVFSYEYKVSLNLLGRQIFFKQFTITFEEQKHLIHLN